MKSKKVLLAGATGYLGKHIVAELIKQDYPTKIVARDKSRAVYDEQMIETVEAELTKPETLNGIVKNIDVVISTVGITKQKDGLTYMDVDYQANINLLREAKKHGVKKFIYVSALRGDQLTHLKMCEAKEKFVKELQNSGLNYCILRPNGFFSDMTEFLKMAKKGKAELFADGNFKMNPIHGKDLAEVCVDAIASNEKEIEVGGPEMFTHKEMVELAFSTVNKKVKISYMPEWLRKMILWFARTFTSSKSYGPMEFFFTVLAMDMVAPKYGKHKLSDFFKGLGNKNLEIMKITYYLYNAFIIEWDDKKIAIDPGALFAYWFSFASLIPKEEWSDITHIFVTHGDPDHYLYVDKVMEASGAPVIFNKTMVKEVDGKSLMLGPRSKGMSFDTPVSNYHTLSVDESIELDGMQIKGVKASHGPLTVKIGPFKKTEDPAKNERVGWGSLGFEINYKGKTIVNLGDSLLEAEEWKKIKNPDVLMIPIGGGEADNTMDEFEALEAIKIIQPKLVIPMHYDLPILFTKHYASVDETMFKREIEKLGFDCMILKKGQSLQIN